MTENDAPDASAVSIARITKQIAEKLEFLFQILNRYEQAQFHFMRPENPPGPTNKDIQQLDLVQQLIADLSQLLEAVSAAAPDDMVLHLSEGGINCRLEASQCILRRSRFGSSCDPVPGRGAKPVELF